MDTRTPDVEQFQILLVVYLISCYSKEPLFKRLGFFVIQKNRYSKDLDRLWLNPKVEIWVDPAQPKCDEKNVEGILGQLWRVSKFGLSRLNPNF